MYKNMLNKKGANRLFIPTNTYITTIVGSNGPVALHEFASKNIL